MCRSKWRMLLQLGVQCTPTRFYNFFKCIVSEMLNLSKAMYFSRFKTPARLLLLTNERVSRRFVFKCLFCCYSNGWDTGQRRQSSSKFRGGDGCRGPQLLGEDLQHCTMLRLSTRMLRWSKSSMQYLNDDKMLLQLLHGASENPPLSTTGTNNPPLAKPPICSEQLLLEHIILLQLLQGAYFAQNGEIRV